MMTMKVLLLRWAVAAALGGAALCSCGNSSHHPATTPSGSTSTGGGSGNCVGAGGGICLTMKVSVTGVAPASGTVQIPDADYSSCAEWATGPKDPSNTFFIPKPYGATVGGKDFSFNLNTQGSSYNGPGTYPEGVFGGAIGVGGRNFFAGSGTGTSGQTTINADGSGSFVFTNLIPVTGSGRDSGSFTWTCS